MFHIVDARWRGHLYEMDYLQEGINLRAMGQKDPLVEWQREGYDMFGQMMHGISQDFVRYIMHVEVVHEQQPEPAPVQNVTYTSSDDAPVDAFAGQTPIDVGEETDTGLPPAAAEPETMQPVVKSEWDKTSRNAPCPCGSGKKYKFCHGK